MIKVLQSFVMGPLEPYAAGFAGELERQGYAAGTAGKLLAASLHWPACGALCVWPGRCRSASRLARAAGQVDSISREDISLSGWRGL